MTIYQFVANALARFPEIRSFRDYVYAVRDVLRANGMNSEVNTDDLAALWAIWRDNAAKRAIARLRARTQEGA